MIENISDIKKIENPCEGCILFIKSEVTCYVKVRRLWLDTTGCRPNIPVYDLLRYKILKTILKDK